MQQHLSLMRFFLSLQSTAPGIHVVRGRVESTYCNCILQATSRLHRMLLEATHVELVTGIHAGLKPEAQRTPSRVLKQTIRHHYLCLPA